MSNKQSNIEKYVTLVAVDGSEAIRIKREGNLLYTLKGLYFTPDGTKGIEKDSLGFQETIRRCFNRMTEEPTTRGYIPSGTKIRYYPEEDRIEVTWRKEKISKVEKQILLKLGEVAKRKRSLLRK
jgi:hypothetical protein